MLDGAHTSEGCARVISCSQALRTTNTVILVPFSGGARGHLGNIANGRKKAAFPTQLFTHFFILQM